MNNGFLVIDADRHVMEPSDLWDRYLEPEFKGRVRITGPFQSRRYVDGRPVSDSDQLPRDRTYAEEAMSAALFTEDPLYRSVFSDSVAHGFDPPSNLHDMDREGVDVAVLFPTLGLYIIWDDEIEPAISAAICRAYNNWLAEYCSHDRARLKGVALIPLHDTGLAVEELRRAKNELGLSGIFWRPNRLKGRTFGHPDYFPLYEVASELEMPVCVHEGARTVMAQAGSDRYSAFGRHVACHPLEQMLAALTLAADGVLERFPKLKVAQLEAGCGWLPYWLERMDEHWKHYTLGRERTTRELPSTYWKRQCVISCEAGEELIGCFVEHVGDDYLIMATDYPHADAAEKFPERTVGDLANNTDLSEATRRKILWDNPARLYGIRETPDTRSHPAPTGQLSSTAERGIKGMMARLVGTVSLLLLLPGSAAAQEQKLQRLHVVWSTIGGTTASLWVTKEAGLFAKQGLDVQLILILASTRAASSIIAGDVDLGLIGSTAPVLARLAGSDLVIIGNSTTHAIFSLMAHPSITEIAQLKGKTLGVVRFGSVSDIGLQHALRNSNIDPNRDVKLLQIGGIGEMLAAMKAGGIHGGLFPPPLSLDAKRLGFRELMDPDKVDLRFAQSHLSIRRAYIRERADTVRRFIKAWVEGIHHVKTNKDFTLRVLKKYTQSDDPAALEETYKIFALKYLPQAPYPTEESVRTILDLVSGSQPKAKAANPKEYIEPTFVRELEESGFIKSLYR